MRGNTILLKLAKCQVTHTGNLFQYDYGQRLVLSGVTLPGTYEVHFSNQEHGNSKTMLGDSTGVDIPDEYLLTGENIHVWVYLHDGESDGETEYHGVIGVTKRAKPTDQAPTPVQQSVIDQAIAALNAGVTEVEGIAEAMPGEIQEALAEAKASGEFDGFSPTATVSKSGDTATISITDKEGTTTAQVKDGAKGDPGDPGQDGFSPIATVTKSDDTATISITDKNGTTTATVKDGKDGTDGQDGFSPSASVSKSGTKATISITDKNGTTTAEVSDGTDGTPGQDGYSPTATVTKSGSVATISITDKNGTTTAQVSDGQDGDTGATPVISIGTVSTLSPGASATASMDTTDPAHPVLSLGIPEGEPGEVTEAELFDATHDRWNEDKEPYLFRASGGDASVYEWERDTLVGGTVAWNQRHPANLESKSEIQGIIRTASDDRTKLTYTGTATITDNYTASSIGGFVPGHKFLLSLGNVILPTGVKILGANADRSTATIIMLNNNTYIQVSVTINQGVTVNFTISPQVFDLTQMFGSTIADYIYTLETGTPGAGVAWLKKHGFMTKPYYAYDAGTLMSGKAESHVTVGFNLWDEEWENGRYDADGCPQADDTRIRTKNPIRVIGGATYYMKSPNTLGIRFYDANDNFISDGYITTISNNTITAPIYAYYLRFSVVNTATYANNICINLSSSRNGEYEPYSAHTYALDSDLELRGIPKIANGKLFYDGDSYESDGTVKRRYGIVDLGTLNWQYYDIVDHYRFIATLTGIKDCSAQVKANIICSKYSVDTANNIYNNVTDKRIGTNSNILFLCDSAYTDAATFKTAMSGVYLVYELATPTTESADPFTNPQAVSPYGTEEYTDSRAVPIPVGHETRYLMDAFQYTEQKLAASQTLMELIVTANREEAMKATKAYTTGNLIIVNGTLYRTTTSIANGANLTVGTNVTATNIATELANLA